MEDWSDGYRTDIGYTYGYYHELNPVRARLALLGAGLACPEFKTACELGFGQGVSVNIHDGASNIEWHGTDFNPSHAGFARELAAGSPLAERLFDASFAEFCRRPDLPDFDFIGLHGIWSWVSDANREVIADFIKRKLKVGGVLYISYNTQPGWAPMVPLRDLLTGIANMMVAPGTDTGQRLEASLDFAERLLSTDARYAQANPHVLPHLQGLRKQNRNYLAHEYFNRDWVPMPFSRTAEWMAAAKLEYAGSAHFLDDVPNLNLTSAQQQLLAEIPDAHLRETARDFLTNQRFRRDYWVRGIRRLSPLEKLEKFRAVRVILAKPVAKVPLTAAGMLGEGDLNQDIYRPLLAALSDYRIHTVQDLEETAARHRISLPIVVEATKVLIGIGVLHPVQDEQAISAAAPAARSLNGRILALSRYGDTINYLASPVTGGALVVNRLEQMFLLARSQGAATPGEWARFADHLFNAMGQRVVLEGKELSAGAAQLGYLTEQATQLQDHMLDIYHALGIVD